LDSESFGYRV
jgi:hypothetical protein